MKEEQAFQVGQFIGSALIYILLGLVLFKIFQALRRIRKKDDSSNKDQA